jgi:GT2 family glycosyltransferase
VSQPLPATPGLVSVVTAIDDHVLDPRLLLRALARQTTPSDRFEAILVDPHGLPAWPPAHAEWLSEGPAVPVRYERIDGQGRARALNRALDLASGELIIFLADDFIPGPEFVASHLCFHAERTDPETVGIGRVSFPPALRANPFMDWLESRGGVFGVKLDEARPKIPEDFFFVGNASVKRALIDAAGRFDEDFLFHCWDDFEYGLRLGAAGMRAELVAGADTVHEHPLTLRERSLQMRQAGLSAATLERKLPGDGPWPGPADVPVWRWRAAAAKWWCRHGLTRREEYRRRFYDRTLNGAFAAGMRAGRRAS